VHQDGDWHRSFHLWVVTSGETGEPAVLFQRRSAAKDTNPGRLDVAVGGHYRAGEGFDDVVREIEEELGFAPLQASLTGIGRRWSVDVRPAWVDREIQDVYVYRYSGSVAELRPSHEEIDALDLIPVAAMDVLYAGSCDAVITERYEVQPGNHLGAMTTARVTLDDFIPVRDRYWLAGSHAAARVFAGETDVQLLLDR
jgi:isopentenyldiphosphate isomerase